MNLKPWREIAIPHADVHKGTFVQAEFAADISRVHDGSATEEYQDPELFFQRTFITEGMAALLASVAKRLAGDGGDPVIQLQTAFGGGKTHTLLAVMHMVSGVPADKLAGVPELLKQSNVSALPQAKVVVLDGIKLSPSQPRKVEGATLNTLWGELAWQLGGAQAYAKVAKADADGTSPGKDTLAELLNAHSPCVILMDEVVAYVRQFEEGRKYARGVAGLLAGIRPRGRQCARHRGPARAGTLLRARAGDLEAGERGRIVRGRAPAAVRADCRPRRGRQGVPRVRGRLHRAQGQRAGRDAGGALLRPIVRGLSDPSGIVRAALYRLVQLAQLPAHARRTEADGAGDPPAVAGRQSGPADPAGQPAAVRPRRAQRADQLPAARLGSGDRSRRGRRAQRTGRTGNPRAALRRGAGLPARDTQRVSRQRAGRRERRRARHRHRARGTGLPSTGPAAAPVSRCAGAPGKPADLLEQGPRPLVVRCAAEPAPRNGGTQAPFPAAGGAGRNPHGRGAGAGFVFTAATRVHASFRHSR